jgi:hypothetical protein
MGDRSNAVVLIPDRQSAYTFATSLATIPPLVSVVDSNAAEGEIRTLEGREGPGSLQPGPRPPSKLNKKCIHGLADTPRCSRLHPFRDRRASDRGIMMSCQPTLNLRGKRGRASDPAPMRLGARSFRVYLASGVYRIEQFVIT